MLNSSESARNRNRHSPLCRSGQQFCPTSELCGSPRFLSTRVVDGTSLTPPTHPNATLISHPCCCKPSALQPGRSITPKELLSPASDCSPSTQWAAAPLSKARPRPQVTQHPPLPLPPQPLQHPPNRTRTKTVTAPNSNAPQSPLPLPRRNSKSSCSTATPNPARSSAPKPAQSRSSWPRPSPRSISCRR